MIFNITINVNIMSTGSVVNHTVNPSHVDGIHVESLETDECAYLGC